MEKFKRKHQKKILRRIKFSRIVRIQKYTFETYERSYISIRNNKKRNQN